METLSGAGNLSSIKTAVFYRWNAYLPKNASDLKSCYDIFFKDYSSTEVFYLSEDSSTDHLGFVEYDYKIKPEKENYKSIVKGNLFDTETKELCKNKDTGTYNYNSLAWLSKYMVPQYRQESEKNFKKEFFGLITKDSETYIYIDVPGEDRDLETLKKPGVWKVELYSEILTTNNYFSSNFIEYSVLEKCNKAEESIKPSLTIIFGPPIDARQNYLDEYNNSENSYRFFYNSSDLKGYIPEYPTSSEQKNIDGWINLCREISSNKLISIIITSDNYLSGVNLSYISWEKSPNPNRNQNKYSLRNDYFWATREVTKATDNKNSEDFLYDLMSGTLLGTKRLYQGSTPSLERRLKALNKKFHARKVYGESEIVAVNDSLYISLISGNLGENPMYSNYWKYLRKYEGEPDEKLLMDVSKETLKELKSILSPKHSNFFIHTNNKTFSDINPVGEVSYKEGISKVLKIKPHAGYILDGIEVNGKPFLEYVYKQDEGCYEYILESTSEKVGTVEDIFIKVEKSISMIILTSPLKIFEDKNIPFNSVQELCDSLDLKINFYLDNYISGQILKEGIGQEKEMMRRYLLPDEKSRKVYLKINDELSKYQVKELIDQKTNELIPLIVEGEISTEDVSPYDSIFLVSSEKDLFTSKDLSLVLEPKILDVSINTNLFIDSSSVGEYIIYGESVSINFTTNIELSVFDRLEYTFLGSNTITITQIGSYDDLGNLGNYDEDRVACRLVNNNGIYTCTLNNVKKNCKIEIFGKSL